MTKPHISLKFEVVFPSEDGSPSRKFMVDRRLKAQWSDDASKVSKQILDEIRSYKGDFVGDLMASMSLIVSSELDLSSEENKRDTEVCQWLSSLIDSMIYTGIREGIHRELIDVTEVVQWDGDVARMAPVRREEVRNANVEKLLLLLSPRLKQALYLISKDMKKV